MPAIHVCPLSRLKSVVANARAAHVVTLINAHTPVPTPAGIAPDRHLLLNFNDICDPVDGMTLPGEAHVVRFLNFVERWDRASPLVVHCWAGVSRSTAAAYAALCALRPDRDETELALALRRRSPEATPNRLFVRIADDLLGREGRMVRAVEGIGRGAECFEGRAFVLPVWDDREPLTSTAD